MHIISLSSEKSSLTRVAREEITWKPTAEPLFTHFFRPSNNQPASTDRPLERLEGEIFRLLYRYRLNIIH